VCGHRESERQRGGSYGKQWPEIRHDQCPFIPEAPFRRTSYSLSEADDGLSNIQQPGDFFPEFRIVFGPIRLFSATLMRRNFIERNRKSPSG
jgi:hypothetical protein